MPPPTPIVVKSTREGPSQCSRLRLAKDYIIVAQSEQFVMVRLFDCGPSLCDSRPVSGGASVP